MPFSQLKECRGGQTLLTVVVAKVVAVKLAAETTHEQTLKFWRLGTISRIWIHWGCIHICCVWVTDTVCSSKFGAENRNTRIGGSFGASKSKGTFKARRRSDWIILNWDVEVRNKKWAASSSVRKDMNDFIYLSPSVEYLETSQGGRNNYDPITALIWRNVLHHKHSPCRNTKQRVRQMSISEDSASGYSIPEKKMPWNEDWRDLQNLMPNMGVLSPHLLERVEWS
jgi:hypothetical protein